MKISLGTDHAGFHLKEAVKHLLESLGHEVKDFGTFSEESVDYPLFVRPAAEAVAKIQSQVLPSATVLNTRNNEALINRGAREGFKDGQQVIVTRGREEVATATVFGTDNKDVTWSVRESDGGSVTANGLYTAPRKPGTYHVRAKSQFDKSQFAEATITVKAGGADLQIR